MCLVFRLTAPQSPYGPQFQAPLTTMWDPIPTANPDSLTFTATLLPYLNPVSYILPSLYLYFSNFLSLVYFFPQKLFLSPFVTGEILANLWRFTSKTDSFLKSSWSSQVDHPRWSSHFSFAFCTLVLFMLSFPSFFMVSHFILPHRKQITLKTETMT